MRFPVFDDFIDLVGDRYGRPGRPQPEEQNSDYESATVMLGEDRWRMRTARVTPKKQGAFVAVWQREVNGETGPFASDEGVAGLMVFVRDEQHGLGMFRFTSTHLEQLGITRSATKPGKRGFRVYPSWCTGLNTQAARTQRAQVPAFLLLSQT